MASTPYDRAHRRRRKALLHDAIGTRCPGTTVNEQPYRSRNCTQIMTDPARMHLDHGIPVVLGGTRGDRIICAPCNTGAGALLGNLLRNPPSPRRQTRDW